MASPGLRVARRRNGLHGAGCGTGSTSRMNFFRLCRLVGAAGLGWVREHSALGGVRVGSAGVGHAEFGAREGRGAACDLLGSSQPSHGLPPLPPPPLSGGLNWAPRCSPEEWTAWCRIRDGLDVSNDYFETVQIEQEVEEVFDLTGIAEAEGWDPTELMFFVFEFGTKKGMKYCREYYDMKNSARQVVPQVVVEEDKPVFDLVGVAEAEGWDQTELMFFVFEYGVENGISFCREYYEMKSRQEVRQAVCPESTKEAQIQFLFRRSGGLRVQEVEGGLTLEEWFASRADLEVGLDGYFHYLGWKGLEL